MKFFHARKSTYHTNAKLVDNVIYTPYRYDDLGFSSKNSKQQPQEEQLINIEEDPTTPPVQQKKKKSKFLVTQDTNADLFLFGYGVVVLWGMTEAQEKRFLSSVFVALPTMCWESLINLMPGNDSRSIDYTMTISRWKISTSTMPTTAGTWTLSGFDYHLIVLAQNIQRCDYSP
jgi:hypothetical protein